MARITQQQKEENKANYNALIVKIFLAEGWSSVTYDRLAKETGLRKSTLQGYYPSNSDFAVALKGKIFPIIAATLDFSSKDTFIQSWERGLSQTEFSMVIRMFIANAAMKESHPQTKAGVTKLIELVAHKLPEENALQLIDSVMGTSVIKLLFAD
ncbi:hypothetical protein [Vibrio ezurae]|uniref:HTH tetR-type domain-containing protein n=1 Tax=Vibrio ezurae NBRC 102218 TaxID=1219080 RepID=U3B3Z3_9VIBR|nr:hypothetical protein [Vibrio ezurae]GAD80177.1 hypothetical protein VEZ01S_26_00150 [Vibrio ezurae NBRC 102218]